MKAKCLHAGLGYAVLAAVALATVATPAMARSMSFGDGLVRVSVGFNTQVPLADDKEQTIMSAQEAGRKFLYTMASKECATLKATIAKACRLTNLNISTQVRERNNNVPLKLYLNGNAQFTITLKDGEFD